MNNNIELLIKLGVNTAPSQANLQLEIDKLAKKLIANVELKFDERSMSALGNSVKKISGADLTKLTESLNTAKKGVEGLNDKLKNVGKDMPANATESLKKQFTDVQKVMDATFKNFSKTFQDSMKKGITDAEELKKTFAGMKPVFKEKFEVVGTDSTGRQVKELKAIEVAYERIAGQVEKIKFNNRSMVGMGDGSDKPLWLPDKEIKSTDSTMNKAELSAASFQKRLNELRATSRITTEQFNELTVALSKMTTPNSMNIFNQRLSETVANQAKAIAKTKEQETTEQSLQKSRQKTIEQLERMSASGKLTTAQSTGFMTDAQGAKTVEQMDKIRQSIALTAIEHNKVTAETTKQSTAITNLNNRIQDLVIKQKLSTAEAAKLTASYSSSTGSKEIAAINRELTVSQNKQAQANRELKEQVALQEKIRKLINDITTAQNRNPKAMGANSGTNEMLATLRQIDPASKSASASVKGVSDSFGKLKADSTSAGRESIGVMESFKIAMEKFPIWMAASTIFFQSIRTAKEFGSIILDIDTKMTSLKKVMSEDTDFEAIFSRATESAEKFGQSISNAMDSYIEFAKQGYKGDELGALADSAIIASNVGDITSQKASEYMTASLVQWKKDAKDSMGIIDSWNEISNNYATTTEKLAQGHARSGAAARAMGLEFDQVNAIIGTVTAATKQSGNEVG